MATVSANVVGRSNWPVFAGRRQVGPACQSQAWPAAAPISDHDRGRNSHLEFLNATPGGSGGVVSRWDGNRVSKVCGTVTGAAFGTGKVTQCNSSRPCSILWSRIIIQKMEIYSNRSQVADRWELRVNLTELNGRDEGA